MQIRLDKLKGRPRTIKFCEAATVFPRLAELVEEESANFLAPVTGDLVATRAGDVIEVSGELTTEVELPCSRCLKAVPCTLNIDLRLCYVPTLGGTPGILEEEKELSAEDLGLIPVEGEELDLRPELEQEVIMAFPGQPLCKNDCAGLCPVCGLDQNIDSCRCEAPVFHAGFAALKNLKVDKQE